VCQLTDDPAFQETAATRGILRDKLLEWKIRSVLAERHATIGLSGIAVSVNNGMVILSGTVGHPDLSKVAIQTISEVPGVVDVESRLVAVNNVIDF